MRGKVYQGVMHNLTPRITPAYAGKRLADVAGKLAAEDHPRVCGEKSMYDYGNNTAQGSPPHVRGKVQKSQAVGLVNGITPACAGKRLFFLPIFNLCGDHPRVCGEKLSWFRNVV